MRSCFIFSSLFFAGIIQYCLLSIVIDIILSGRRELLPVPVLPIVPGVCVGSTVVHPLCPSLLVNVLKDLLPVKALVRNKVASDVHKSPKVLFAATAAVTDVIASHSSCHLSNVCCFAAFVLSSLSYTRFRSLGKRCIRVAAAVETVRYPDQNSSLKFLEFLRLLASFTTFAETSAP